MNSTSEKRIEILSNHLNVRKEEILHVNENDKGYIVRNSNQSVIYFVMNESELLQNIKVRIMSNNKIPFSCYEIKEVISVLGVTKEEIYEFYIPHILTGKLKKEEVMSESIDGMILLEYLERNNCEERFAEGLSKILIDTDSYWYLFSYKDKRKVGEYTIFTFHNDWDMFFD